MLYAHIESTLRMPSTDIELLKAVAHARFDSPETAQGTLNTIFFGTKFSIYRGGSHVAVHHSDCPAKRVAIWKPL